MCTFNINNVTVLFKYINNFFINCSCLFYKLLLSVVTRFILLNLQRVKVKLLIPTWLYTNIISNLCTKWEKGLDTPMWTCLYNISQYLYKHFTDDRSNNNLSLVESWYIIQLWRVWILSNIKTDGAKALQRYRKGKDQDLAKRPPLLANSLSAFCHHFWVLVTPHTIKSLRVQQYNRPISGDLVKYLSKSIY